LPHNYAVKSDSANAPRLSYALGVNYPLPAALCHLYRQPHNLNIIVIFNANANINARTNNGNIRRFTPNKSVNIARIARWTHFAIAHSPVTSPLYGSQG
jgi:hypothetical protein